MHPIAIQSKKWIIDSTLTLMEQKPYSTITVSEISSNAQIDRRTFYRHFKQKDDILVYFIHEISEAYLCALTKNHPTDTYTISLIFFELCQQHAKFLTLLHKQHLMYFLLDKFYDNLLYIHAQIRSDALAIQLQDDIDYFVYFHAGGFWSLLFKWLEDGMMKTPHELATLASKITNHLI